MSLLEACWIKLNATPSDTCYTYSDKGYRSEVGTHSWSLQIELINKSFSINFEQEIISNKLTCMQSSRNYEPKILDNIYRNFQSLLFGIDWSSPII